MVVPIETLLVYGLPFVAGQGFRPLPPLSIGSVQFYFRSDMSFPPL